MKILIYVNDLETDLPGMKLGEIIARNLEAEVTLLSVHPKDDKKKQGQLESKTVLEAASQRFTDLKVGITIRRGKVYKRIVDEVKETKQDMVVISSSRVGGYPRNVSIPKDCLPKIPCSVVIARTLNKDIKHILILTGGLRVSESMIRIGAQLACSLEAKVTLMHVAANVPSMYTGLGTIEETLEEMLHTDTPVAKHLRKCAQILDSCDVPSDLKLKHGEPVYEIIKEVEDGGYDFMMMGASGATTALKEWFLRNVTKDVIDLVGIPIMIVNQSHAETLN
jgi:nucleotide-binding universal stress UspA family protein